MTKLDISEHQNYELKTSWNDEVLKEIVSFANSEGGTVFVGLNDEYEILGLDNSKDLLEKIPNKIHDILGLILAVNLRKKEGKEYIEIIVHKSSVPVSCRGKYYKRSGSTKRELKGNELNKFIQSFSHINWDAFIEKSATTEELDYDTIHKFRKISKERLSFSQETDDDIELLEKLGLIIDGNLTRAAILLFGKNPQKYYTSAIFKIGKFNNEGELVAQDVIEGNLFKQVNNIEEILKTKYLIFDVSFEGMKRIERLEYPTKALREIIVNALIHKDYMGTAIQMKIHPDKLILWNEGVLPEVIPVEKLYKSHPSLPRNELLAKIFFSAEYIDAWGRGIDKILEACRDNELPEPEFVEDFGGLQVTLFKDIYTDTFLKKEDINERQIAAIKYLKINKEISNQIYQKINDVSKATASNELKDLVKKSMLIQKGITGRGTTYVLCSQSERANKGLKGLTKGL